MPAPGKPRPPVSWLDRPGPWGMTVHEWLAAICAAPSGGFGFWLAVNGRPWAGLLLLCFAFGIRAWVMGEDLDNPKLRR